MLCKRIRSGEWVNENRLRSYPLILVGVSLMIAVWAVAFGHGLLDAGGRPLGTDFLSFWSASSLLGQGRPAEVYDHDALFATEQSVAGLDTPLYTWLYPPMALLLVAPLATLPYLQALTVWLSATLIGYVAALWRFIPYRGALLPILAFPPVFINLGHGQNGFLSAALLGWGLILLPRLPWLAGALMGLIIYKPQLGLLLPVALLAARNWRAFIGAGLAVAALSVASLGWLGADVWAAFLAKSDYSLLMLEQGLVPWQKMISSFATARMLGASVGFAWAVQATVSLACAGVVWFTWRSPASYLVKIAALTTGTLLAAPLALDYDATLLGIALVALVAEGLQRGFRDWEISVLALVWMMPLYWRPLAMAANIPLAPITLLLVLWLVGRRVMSDKDAYKALHPS